MSRQDGSDRQVSASSVDSSTATILHVDLDAFFASVELLDRPDLVHRPVVVAGNSARSVVTAANYPARKFGVRSAIPLSQALRLCPHAVVLEPHREKYTFYSQQVMAAIGELIRSRVFAETRLHCSVGAASVKFVAKLASGRAKPDGMLVIPAGETLAFLHPLPVSFLWGVGATTEESLTKRGFRTIGDVARAPVPVLQRVVGDAAAHKLHELANGIDARRVTPGMEEKSVGHEVTFEVDISDAELLRRELLRQADAVAVRLRAGGWVGRTIVLKLRYSDFRTITRSRTITDPTNLGRRIYEEVRAIYDLLGAHEPVRLIGVRVEHLEPAGGQRLSLWDDDGAWRDAERTIDGVSERFGRGALRPASLLGPASHLVQRGKLGDARQRPRAGD